MSHQVRYDKTLRERAKTERKFLVTVAVDGRQIGDDSCTVQMLADLKLAQRIGKLVLDLLKTKGNR